MKRTVFIAGICAAALPVLSDPVVPKDTAPARSPKQAGKGPLKVFILAGQYEHDGPLAGAEHTDAGLFV